jgi:hypothetical protein
MTSMALPPGMHKMLLKELETKNTRPKSAPTEAEEDGECYNTAYLFIDTLFIYILFHSEIGI